MGSERDDMKKIENGKQSIIITGVIAIIGAAVKFLSDNNRENKLNELRRERDNINRTFFKSSADRSKLREIDDKINRLKK